MSKIQQMMDKFLRGAVVEFKQLWEITDWDKKFKQVETFKQKNVIKFRHVSNEKLKLLAIQYGHTVLEIDSGEVKLLSTGKFNKSIGMDLKILDIVNEGEIISIPSGGSANIKYHKGYFIDSGNILSTSKNPQQFNLKYIYYYLLKIKNKVQGAYQGSGVQHPNMGIILNLKIPIPPIEVQQEIVQILDKFTQLKQELEQELEQRKKQYKYYRNKLLSFDANQVSWQELGG